MNSLFKKRLSSFLLQLVIVTVLLYAVHSYVTHYFNEAKLFFPLWHIYVFLFIVTFLIYAFINYRYSKAKTEVFNMFMIATLLKMILALIFLLPLILSDFKSKKIDVINFFLPYFIFLAFEVLSISKFLQNNTPENQ